MLKLKIIIPLGLKNFEVTTLSYVTCCIYEQNA